MDIKLNTERLLIREISYLDINDLFEMDSDPDVRKYIDNNPVNLKSELLLVIEMLQEQYLKNGTARWAVVDKQSNEMIGWAGLKLFREEVNGYNLFYELGYRFKQKHWGKDYASEDSKAIITYCYNNFNIDSIFAMTHPQNKNSIHVLEKLGFQFKNVFDYDGLTNWFELEKSVFVDKIK